ncbi:histidine phosphatase family protein [Metabacillus malikii]|uniref:histidine phosphatase family protein n=1 Tax=Metabacillus malikii TaxID=1504265 RepID=UPI0027D779C8|nr:histidine phosphatase family protein [Metabacillus malikii]
MSTISIVRHGETDWNIIGKLQGQTDIPLNQHGMEQAMYCGNFLKTEKWDVIITSPLKRAKQTAEIINKCLNLPIVEMEEFVERGFGIAEGMEQEERLERFPTGIIPDQEEMNSFENRVVTGIEKVRQRYFQQKIVLIAHGAVINALLANLSNGEIGTGKTEIVNASISNIQYNETGWKIKEYNIISHLPLDEDFQFA